MRTKTQLLLSAAVYLILSGQPQAAPNPAAKVQFHLEVQPLSDAVAAWAKQSGLQLIWPTGSVAVTSRLAPKVSGLFSPDEALSRLLAGTGLTYTFVDAQTVAIRSTTAEAMAGHEMASRVQLARVDDQAASPQASASAKAANVASEDTANSNKIVDEVVVTGTNIRGGSSISPVQVFSREEIDVSGLGSVQEFIQRLPQNFNGGATEDALSDSTGGGGVANSVGATGVNLRGLGNDSTLVLLNGRRLAPSGYRGNFADVSMIPMAALDRVEVLTDGASAIYGSDAVGGVVNFILRRDFDGAETRLRYGSAAHSDSEEVQASQAIGKVWERGSGMLSYEYYDRTTLVASERDFSKGAPPTLDLLPAQRRHSFFFTGEHSVSAKTALFMDALYSERDTTRDFLTTGVYQRYPAAVKSSVGTIGGRGELFSGTTYELSASWTRSDSRTQTINMLNGTLAANRDVTSYAKSVDGRLGGRLWRLPGGMAQYAVGFQYRSETFDANNLLAASTFKEERDVYAGFAEIRLPVVGEGAGTHPRLELSLADRFESYSDFGSTNNPKIGLHWRPSSSLTAHATLGTSFKAPLLVDLDPIPTPVVAINLFDPSVSANTASILIFGGRDDLEPEEATMWTIGFDLTPADIPNFRASLSYYNISYDNRIVLPSSNISFVNALRSESILGPEIIIRNPGAALTQELMSYPGFIVAGPVNLNAIGAVVDYRSRNLSEVLTSGIDLGVSYLIDGSFSDFSVKANGTYILDYSNKFNDASPAREILDTPYNPAALRLRTELTWQLEHFTASAFVNYVDSYSDNRTSNTQEIDAWTTADLTFGYRFPQRGDMLGNLSILLSCVNFTDEDPPFVENPNFPVHFDSANANALRRYTSIQISKQF